MIATEAVAEQAMADLELAKGRLEGLDWLDDRRVGSVLQPLR